MRMRRKKHGAERIAACAEILIDEPKIPAVDPVSYFTAQRPVHLEIGCGKGDFAVGMAAKHQDVNFIAMERVSDVACLALEKAMNAKESCSDNLRFLIGDAKNLVESEEDLGWAKSIFSSTSYDDAKIYDKQANTIIEQAIKDNIETGREMVQGYLEEEVNRLMKDGTIEVPIEEIVFDNSGEDLKLINEDLEDPEVSEQE